MGRGIVGGFLPAGVDDAGGSAHSCARGNDPGKVGGSDRQQQGQRAPGHPGRQCGWSRDSRHGGEATARGLTSAGTAWPTVLWVEGRAAPVGGHRGPPRWAECPAMGYTWGDLGELAPGPSEPLLVTVTDSTLVTTAGLGRDPGWRGWAEGQSLLSPGVSPPVCWATWMNWCGCAEPRPRSLCRASEW